MFGHVITCPGAALDGVDQIVEHVDVVRIVGSEKTGGATAWAGGPLPGVVQGLGVEPVAALLVKVVAVHLLDETPGEHGSIAGAA